MSSSDFETGCSGSMCECGSIRGTSARAAVRSWTSVSAGMTDDLRGWGRVNSSTDTSYNGQQELQTAGPPTGVAGESGARNEPRDFAEGTIADRFVLDPGESCGPDFGHWHGCCFTSHRPRRASPKRIAD